MQIDARRTVRLSLELRADGPALAGVVVDESGDEHAFRGWLELLTLLEGTRARLEGAA